MTRTRSKLGAVTIALAAAAAVTQAPHGATEGRSPDLTEILGKNPPDSATRSARRAWKQTLDDVRTAADAAGRCIQERIGQAAAERGLLVDVKVSTPAEVASDPTLSLNWGFTVMSGGADSEVARQEFQIVATALEVGCQTELLDPAIGAHRAARRADAAALNDEATTVARCLTDDVRIPLTAAEIRHAVRALANGTRPPEPLATKVDQDQHLRDGLTTCLLRSPDLLAERDSAGTR